MEIFEQKTTLINLEELTPDELGLICYGLKKAILDVKECNVLYVDDGIACPFYLPPEDAAALLEKLESAFTRMQGRGQVDPEITKLTHMLRNG